MALTSEEKKELKAELLNEMKADSQSMDELETVSTLDGVLSLPAMRGATVVSAPVKLLAKPAEDAAVAANNAASAANIAAENAVSAAWVADAAANTANAAADDASVAAKEAIQVKKDYVNTALAALKGATVRFGGFIEISGDDIDYFSDSEEHSPEEIQYSPSHKLFVVQASAKEYYTSWPGSEMYQNKTLLKDKAYLFGEVLYVWSDEMNNLVEISDVKQFKDLGIVPLSYFDNIGFETGIYAYRSEEEDAPGMLYVNYPASNTIGCEQNRFFKGLTYSRIYNKRTGEWTAWDTANVYEEASLNGYAGTKEDFYNRLSNIDMLRYFKSITYAEIDSITSSGYYIVTDDYTYSSDILLVSRYGEDGAVAQVFFSCQFTEGMLKKRIQTGGKWSEWEEIGSGLRDAMKSVAIDRLDELNDPASLTSHYTVLYRGYSVGTLCCFTNSKSNIVTQILEANWDIDVTDKLLPDYEAVGMKSFTRVYNISSDKLEDEIPAGTWGKWKLNQKVISPQGSIVIE